MPMMYPRHKHALVSIGNYVYAIGGELDSQPYSNSVERFNLKTKGWE